MQADTDAIHAYGAATIDVGAELTATAGLLSRDLAPALADAFGPVGARFAAALADATAGLMTTVATIGDDLADSGAATATAAVKFGEAEQRTRDQITRVGM
jgi:hypothetical protein